MEKNELKENDIKNHACYHFDDVMRVIDINSRDILLDGKRYENKVTFHTKLLWVQYHCVLDSMK